MDITKVVHIKRVGGCVVQNCDVYIGRACNMGGWNLKQSKWANPFTLRNDSIEVVISKYENYIRNNSKLMNDLEELRGKTLGCWCAPGPCHGDVLIKLLNSKDF